MAAILDDAKQAIINTHITGFLLKVNSFRSVETQQTPNKNPCWGGGGVHQSTPLYHGGVVTLLVRREGCSGFNTGLTILHFFDGARLLSPSY